MEPNEYELEVERQMDEELIQMDMEEDEYDMKMEIIYGDELLLAGNEPLKGQTWEQAEAKASEDLVQYAESAEGLYYEHIRPNHYHRYKLQRFWRCAMNNMGWGTHLRSEHDFYMSEKIATLGYEDNPAMSLWHLLKCQKDDNRNYIVQRVNRELLTSSYYIGRMIKDNRTRATLKWLEEHLGNESSVL